MRVETRILMLATAHRGKASVTSALRTADFLRSLSERTELSLRRLTGWLCISRHKFYDWLQRYGKANEHNAKIPRDHWLLPEEKQGILDFHAKHPLEGYRRLTFMMIDADLVGAARPLSIASCRRPDCLIDGTKGRAKKARASSSPSRCTSTGTLMSRT